MVDLILLLDLAARAGFTGIQEWLSFYFKGPQHPPGLSPEHDLFIHLMKLKNTLLFLKGETSSRTSVATATTERANGDGASSRLRPASSFRHILWS